MGFYAHYMNDRYEHDESQVEKAIRELAYIWIDFNDYEKEAFKELITNEGMKIKLRNKKAELSILQNEVKKLEEQNGKFNM